MHRISGTSAVPNLFGPGKSGFTNGVPGSVGATVVADDWLNATQEEVATACEKSGIALDANANSQLFNAIFCRTARSSLVNSSARAPATGSDINAIASRIPAPGQAPLMVLAGNSGAINTSIDGVTWTSRTAAGSYSGAFRAAHADQAWCVVVGDSGEIQTSFDSGVTWTHRAAAGSYTGQFRAFAQNSFTASTPAIVIVGSNGEIQTSSDAVTWTHRTAAGGFTGSFTGVAYSDQYSRFIAVGVNGEVQTSDDNGTTWIRRTSGVTGGFSGIATPPQYATGPIVAVCSIVPPIVDDMLHYSTDGGVTWSLGKRPGSLAMNSQWKSVSSGYLVTEDGGQAQAYYVAVGLSGRMVVSADGKGWMDCSRNILSSFSFNTVCCDPGSGTVIAAGSSPLLMQSLVI